MIFQAFTIYDSKVEYYLPPFFVKNTAEAIRAVTDMCSNKEHQFYKYRDDFCLMHLGSYDDGLGSFASFDAPKNLGRLSEYCNIVDSVS